MPLLAWDPNAAAPIAPLQTLQGDASRLNIWASQLKQIRRRVGATLRATPSAQSVPQIQSLFEEILQSSDTSASASTKAQRWAYEANTAVAQFQSIHEASPGVLGVFVQNTASDWTVQGCMVTQAISGGTASRMGLIGSQQRTDPVGDVITAIQDVTDGNQQWAVPNCAALNKAMGGGIRDWNIGTTDGYH